MLGRRDSPGDLFPRIGLMIQTVSDELNGCCQGQLMPLVKRTGLYGRLKVSLLHDLYWIVTDRRWIEGVVRSISTVIF